MEALEGALGLRNREMLPSEPPKRAAEPAQPSLVSLKAGFGKGLGKSQQMGLNRPREGERC